MTPSYTAQDLTQQQKAEKFSKLGKKTEKNDGKIIRDDDDEDVKVGLETYKQLVGLFGGMKYLILACLVSAFLCYCRIKTDYVIAQWGNDMELQKTKYGQFIIVVSAFALSSLLSEAVKSILLMILNMRAATDMHDGMIQRIVRAPQNLFFDTHSNASVMKRLSEDLGTLENHMADAFVNAVQSI
jgi:ABC-type multidrug transport system fused ATPase/permease subunit